MLRKLTSLAGHTEDRVWHVAWSNDGKFIASTGEDKVIRIWTSISSDWGPDSIRCIATLEDAQSRTIRSCDWSPDGRVIASASFDGTIAIWESRNAQLSSWEMVCTLEGHENEVKCVSWNHDGRWLASCGRDKTVWIWEKVDSTEYECLAMLQGKQGHTQDVKSIRWHPLVSLLVSVSYDDTIKLWKEDHGDWYCVETLSAHKSTVWSVCVDPSGRRLLSCSDDQSLILWQCQNTSDYLNWKLIGVYKDVHNGTIYSVDWNIHNGYIASAGGDNKIGIYNNTDINDDLIQFESRIEDAHQGDVNCVRWNPSVTHSDVLVSSGDDGMVNLWILQI